MSKDTVSRREFVGIGAAVAGASLIGEPIVPATAKLARAASRAPASDRVRFGIIGVGMQGNGLLGRVHPAAGRRVRRRVRPVRRATRAGARDRAAGSPRDAPLPGAARQQGHRLHHRRGARSLAPADRRRRGERRARTSIARSRCRTPPPTAWRWSTRRRRAGASCRSARSASARRSAPRRRR